jgi:hypothetical protein
VKIFLDENDSQETSSSPKLTPEPYKTCPDTLRSTLSIDLYIYVVDQRRQNPSGFCPNFNFQGLQPGRQIFCRPHMAHMTTARSYTKRMIHKDKILGTSSTYPMASYYQKPIASSPLLHYQLRQRSALVSPPCWWSSTRYLQVLGSNIFQNHR